MNNYFPKFKNHRQSGSTLIVVMFILFFVVLFTQVFSLRITRAQTYSQNIDQSNDILRLKQFLELNLKCDNHGNPNLKFIDSANGQVTVVTPGARVNVGQYEFKVTRDMRSKRVDKLEVWALKDNTRVETTITQVKCRQSKSSEF